MQHVCYTHRMPRLHTHSQHFLRSPRLVAELIGHTNIRKNDTVYDLGAGSGVITSVLARRCKHVVAIENEPHALSLLRKNTHHLANVEIMEHDILSAPLPTEAYKIFANIPFAISASIVQRYTQASIPPKAMYVIVQKQFARKLLANHQSFTNQLGAKLAPYFSVRIRKPLQKTDFTPPPAVDTMLLEIRQRTEPLLPETERVSYDNFIEHCFENPTKFTALKQQAAVRYIEKNASQLAGEEWVELYKHLSAKYE